MKEPSEITLTHEKKPSASREGSMKMPPGLIATREDQKEIQERLESIRDQALTTARETIEENGYYRPVVYALTSRPTRDDVDFLFPEVGSPEAKEHSYAIINKHLDEDEFVGAVHVAQLHWVPDADPEELEDEGIAPNEHPDSRPALVAVLHAPGLNDAYLQEFDFAEDGSIEWHEVEGPTTFDVGRITAFKMN